jgi:hypothetical protein
MKFSPLILTKILSACQELYKMTNDNKYLFKGLELYKLGLTSDFNKVFGKGNLYISVSIREFKQATDLMVELAKGVAI